MEQERERGLLEEFEPILLKSLCKLKVEAVVSGTGGGGMGAYKSVYLNCQHTVIAFGRFS